MHLSKTFAHWSDHLQRCSNDTTLAFERDGSLSLLVARQRLDCQIGGNALTLRARICDFPNQQECADQQAWLQRVLLLSNTHVRQRREYPALSNAYADVNADTNAGADALQLITWMHANTDYSEFCIVFDQFIDALAAWRTGLLPLIHGAPVTPTAAITMATVTRRTPDSRFASAPFNIKPSLL